MHKYFHLLILILVFPSLHAQEISRGNIEVPFEFVEDRYVLIKAVMNESDTLTLYFDTGAGTALIGQAVADRIGVEANYQSPVSGAGGTEMYDLALNQKIKISAAEISGIHMVLMDLTTLKEALGRDFDGIIGYHIIRDFVTAVDFDRRIMTLHGKGSKPDLTGYSQHSFEFRGGSNIPVLPLSIELGNGEIYQGDILFDSGAGLSLVINTPFVEEHNLREKFDRSYNYFTQNLNSESFATKVLLPKMKFCGYTIENIPIDLAGDKQGVSSYPGYLGILGSEILNRFNFILDYKKMKLYLKPNSLFSEPFEYRSSGITLRRNGRGIYVFQVVEESPAYKAGLRKGDLVLSVDGLENLEIGEYRRRLTRTGSDVRLVVKRPEGIKTFEFRLVDLLAE